MPTHLLQIAKKLAHDAGLFALKTQEKGFKIEKKDVYHNLVTEVDKECEKMIIQTIKNNFPDHSILSEESSPQEGTGDYKWIIDPIDGTTNFAHGLPFFAISIAVVYKGKPIIGVVEIPAMKETFWAQEGKGAYVNSEKISVSHVTSLKDALLATGFPYDRSGPRYKKNMELWDHFYGLSHGVRRIGTAALDLCYTACGRFDGYWEYNLKPWDIAAGKIILEEAGGTVTNMDGSKLNPSLSNFLASNSRIHSEMLTELKKRGADKL
ncbi:inositol monophosphatase [Patescibacteria group bacterium]|nr:inositol monophosphatase [Patescibacteria group bacterium]